MSPASSKKVLWITALALLALVLFLDQYSKYWIDKKLPIREFELVVGDMMHKIPRYVETDQSIKAFGVPGKPGENGIVIIPNLFSIVHVVNKGAAWGIFHGKLNFLTAISALAFIGMLVFFNRICEGYMERVIGLGLLMGGTLGNLVDRMNLIARDSGIHGVVDFISFRTIISIRFFEEPFDLEYPSFNIADAGICVGVFLLCFSMFLRPEKNGKHSPMAVAIQKKWCKWRGREFKEMPDETA
ncbi:signal peptidase II [bacterium F16]|nr:signal peptidase II [bacterium F16]